jgi:carbonic anhydrase
MVPALHDQENFMRLPALAVLFFATAALAAAQSATPWSYDGKTGPELWGRLDPAYRACTRGHLQAPINIHHARLNKALRPIEFHYMAGPVHLENNGHFLVAHVERGSYIVIGRVRYDLVQYEFHRPSENTVNGKLSDMEVELVHRSADGKLVIVSVLLIEDANQPNATMATLVPNLPAKAGSTAEITDMISTAGLLPADRGYWTYTGSVTTPPCGEGVQWFVFEQPMTISRTQLRAFSAIYARNNRPTQELNGRWLQADE